MHLSIIIVSWNTRDLLAQCLESIVSNLTTDDRSLPEGTVHCPKGLSTEIFIVDNASSDDSAAMVRARFPKVRLIENRENVGFARANNQAIRASTGQYVLLLNPDTVVLPNALREMLRYMNEHPTIGLLGGNLMNVDRTPQVCYGNLPGLASELLTLFGLDRRLPLPERLRSATIRASEPRAESSPVGWVLGACMLIRRTALEQIGLLDEGYFMFSEETDWAWRAWQTGWKVEYLSTAGILHYGGSSTRQVPNRMLPYLYASKARFLTKHRGNLAGMCFRLAALLVVLNKGAWANLERFVSGKNNQPSQHWLNIAHRVWTLR